MPTQGLRLHSLAKRSGKLELALMPVQEPEPGPDEVLIRIDATPINPSDIGTLLAGADIDAAKFSGSRENPVVTATIPAATLSSLGQRIDQPIYPGNEGAGEVIKAGQNARQLLGKTVAVLAYGGMYGHYRTVRAEACLVLPDDVTAVEGASCFINPLTVLAMIETMRREGHKALVHTAAASNLGQMLQKLCRADGIELVNIVRSQAQGDILRGLGAKYVCDSTASTFMNELTAAVTATGATLAFDAIGGGTMVSHILTAMEKSLSNKASVWSRYGSPEHKQVYIYGALEPSPTVLNRTYGMAWSTGGWLVMPQLAKLDAPTREAFRQRIAREIKTTFASHYTRTITLAEVLLPENIVLFNKRTTGMKFLVAPQT